MPERLRKTHLSPPEITRHIRRAVGDSSIAIKTARSPAVLANQILISGVYDHEDDLIEISVNYNPQQHAIELCLVKWPQLAFDVAECIGHEQVHRKLRRKKSRAYDSEDDEQAYLGNSEEIQAYGFSIAADLAVHYDGDINCLPLADMYQVYAKTFAQDQSVMLELEHSARKYLSNFKGGSHGKQGNGTARRARRRT